ncbi:hypothetical protein AUP68_04159 [Ilyonectria robusta]
MTALRCLPLLANLEWAPFPNWSRFPECETGPVPDVMACATLVEVIAYEKLRALQGITIPRWYGEMEYDGTRALILSDIGGDCLATPEGAVLDEKDLHPLLYQALSSLTNLGVSHDDTKLDNFHLVTQDGKTSANYILPDPASYYSCNRTTAKLTSSISSVGKGARQSVVPVRGAVVLVRAAFI